MACEPRSAAVLIALAYFTKVGLGHCGLAEKPERLGLKKIKRTKDPGTFYG